MDTTTTTTAETDLVDEYYCICFGKQILNMKPIVVVSAIFTLILIAISFAMCFVFSPSIFFPIITTAVAWWVPSPASTGTSLSVARTNQTLLLSNMRNMDLMYTRVTRQA